MEIDYIIIGQGICGTMLSWNLMRRGKTVVVIDDAQPFTATKVASGIINPVTGRRVVTTWMIDKLLPVAWDAYSKIGADIGSVIIEHTTTFAFPASHQMMESYNKRIDEKDSYIHLANTIQTSFNNWFNFIFGCYTIDPTYLIDLVTLLEGWRKKLSHSGILLEEEFNDQYLVVNNESVQYKDINAKKIIFCNGINSFQNRFWKNLPYVFNKGQALIAEIPGLAPASIYKFGVVTIAPWQNNLWWIGSSYENEFDTTQPTSQFREATIAMLNKILKIPFVIKEHFAALRPAVVERRPFVGLHPKSPCVGIMNGMGTKGCSLAPFFAQQLTDHLLEKLPLMPEGDVQRFKKILSLSE